MLEPDKQYTLIKHRGRYIIHDNELMLDVGSATKKDGLWEVKMFSEKAEDKWHSWTNCLSIHECVEILHRSVKELK